MKKVSKFHKFNDKAAVILTHGFGSMITAYIFAAYGLLPLINIFAPYQDKFLYWSNWVQLWSLPVLAVGQNVIGKASERRAARMYETVRESHKEQMQEIVNIQEILKGEKSERAEIKKVIKGLKGGEENATKTGKK